VSGKKNKGKTFKRSNILAHIKVEHFVVYFKPIVAEYRTEAQVSSV